ncbi:acyl-CoA synthetase [Leptospira ilyithenensis]|uniref:Acyl-CoA synthetase n=1 Tax=Leptospira ilyithenensis TaxID=2484901 RepID=A0A4R9LQL8_9LEPT|nr:acyl-CoA synthetase [Leptospira ilyithenensis]TGN11864.1 acyl-CoA synthetase [Leptospira ilyithenensis]
MNRSQFEWKIPEFFNIGTAVTDLHLGTKIETRIALVIENETGEREECSFKELSVLSSRFHFSLIRNGYDRDTRVLIRLSNSITYPSAFFGTLKSGAIATPTSTLLTSKEVSYIAKDSGAKVLVTEKSMWIDLEKELTEDSEIETVYLSGEGGLPNSNSRFKFIDLDEELAKKVTLPVPTKTKSDDPAYLVYTSGTTGYPKGVLHAHRALLGRQPASEFWFDFEDHDKILHSGKFNWTYVLGTALMDPLYRGHTVIAYEGKNHPELWIDLIARHKCTIFIGVPTVYRQILQKTDLSKKNTPTLRYCMSAGEHLSDEVLEKWKDRFQVPIYEGLGMSEFSYYISQNKKNGIRPGSAGKIQPGHLVDLIDAEGKKVPPGKEGLIVVSEKDPGLFLRYWNLPDEDKKSRKEGYFITGDYARIDNDGYVWFIGRKDDIINTFGYRVSPYEIERVMKSHPDIADCVAIGEDIGNDKTLVSLCVILHPETNLSEEEVIRFGKERLAEYKAPKKIHFYKNFPRTKNGKILRKEITESLSRITK